MSGSLHTHQAAGKAPPPRARATPAPRRAPTPVPRGPAGSLAPDSVGTLPTYAEGGAALRVGGADSPDERAARRAGERAMAGLPAEPVQPTRAGSRHDASPGRTTVPAWRPPGTGEALPYALRRSLEADVRRDLSAVRIHTGPWADRAAGDLRSDAFTVGSHVVFGAGRFAPATPAGRALLAHELTHVAQQQGGGADPLVRCARWGTRPSGEDLSAKPLRRWLAAELQMEGYFRSSGHSSEWTSNVNLYNEVQGAGWSGRSRRMLRQFQEKFVTDRGTQDRRSVLPADAVPSAAGGGIGDFAQFAKEKVAVALVPDIIDFQNREIYDITTLKQSSAKKLKVLGYAALASGITGEKWTPGKTLRAPGPFWMNQYHAPGELTSFGSTDLADRPGVLSYEVISTKTKKKQKKKDDKKKQKKTKKDAKKQPDKKQPDKKKKPEGKAPPTAGGGANVGFGISILSTGSGSGNAGVGIAIMSHGVSVGTVSAGVVYDSRGRAIGSVGGGASMRSDSTGALTAGGGASRDSTSVGGGVVGAGLSDDSTSAGALNAGAGRSKGSTTAGVLNRGSGTSEENLAAAARTSGSGDTKGFVGVAPSGDQAAKAPSPDGGSPSTGQQGRGQQGQGQGQGDAGVETGGSGQRDAGTPAGKGGDSDRGSGRLGNTTADDRGAPGKNGVGLPGLSPDEADKALDRAGEMDALLRSATPAQRALMEGLVQRQPRGEFTVSGPEWVRLMTSATVGISDADVPYLLGLTWEPAKVSPEELRESVRKALAARKESGRRGTREATKDEPGRASDDTREPAGKKKQVKAAAKVVTPTVKGAGPGVAAKDEAKPKKSQEARDELVARLAARARSETGAAKAGASHISHDKDYRLGTSGSFALFLRHRVAGRDVWVTTDVMGVVEERGKEQVLRVVRSAPVLVSEDGEAVDADLAGVELPLQEKIGGR